MAARLSVLRAQKTGRRRLVATDADWRAGEGAEISGPIQALVMLLAGRTAVVAELTGI